MIDTRIIQFKSASEACKPIDQEEERQKMRERLKREGKKFI